MDQSMGAIAPQQFSLPSPAPTQPGLAAGAAAGLAAGVQSGTQMGTLALTAQQIQAQNAAKAAAIHKDQVDSALDFMGKIGEQLKYFSPDSQKQAIANGLNALAKVAPEFGIQPATAATIPDEAADLVKQYGTLRAAHVAGKVSDADFMQEGSNILNQMSQYQREMMKDQDSILGSPSYEPGQTPSGQPAAFNTKTGVSVAPGGTPNGQPFVPSSTALSVSSENQRAAAAAAAPFFNVSKSYNTGMAALNRKDQVGDRTAIFELGKVLNNGTPMPLDQITEIAKSGQLGTQIQQGIENITGSGSLSDPQRSDLKAIFQMHMDGMKQAVQGQMSMFPGAQGPTAAAPQYSVGQVVTGKGGKSYKFNGKGPSNVPTSWDPQ